MHPTLLALTGLLVLLYMLLTANVLRLRVLRRQSLGDGDFAPLTRAIRAHANFNEYVPLILLMVWICAQQGIATGWLPWLLALLLVGRISHAYSILVDEPRTDRAWPYFRSAGMITTLTVLGLLALRLLGAGLAA